MSVSGILNSETMTSGVVDESMWVIPDIEKLVGWLVQKELGLMVWLESVVKLVGEVVFVVLEWAQCLLESVVNEGAGFDSSILWVVVSEMWSENLSFLLGAEVPDLSEVFVPLNDLVSWELGSDDESFSIFDWELVLII